MLVCDRCKREIEGYEIYTETIEGETLCNECDCKRLSEENFVETDNNLLNKAKGDKEAQTKDILTRIANRLPRGEDFEAELNELFALYDIELEEWIGR